LFTRDVAHAIGHFLWTTDHESLAFLDRLHKIGSLDQVLVRRLPTRQCGPTAERQ
jgi:hypothetical protein